ncbi:MAG TPA: response regulator [Syntrophorhabdales bacterium]|nr:response regulator [Syntrophorhabdales bacterium]
MKKKILIADKDSSLKEAFRIIFSEDKYDVLYAASAKEIERLLTSERPDIYIVNVNLSKSSGIEVYRKLQKDRFLDNARFFFMKDENDSTELLGFQAEGVIEKPINFFKVHERIAKDDDVVLLTDEVIEPEPQRVVQEPIAQTRGPAIEEAGVKEDIGMRIGVESLAREFSGHTVAGKEEMAPVLEAELRKVLNQTVEEMAPRFVDRLTTVLSTFIEDYTRRVLYEIAEKVIREEIDKLLKESGS